MENTPYQIEQARLLVARMERISADSIWARRASGLRGALLKWLEKYDQTQKHDAFLPSLSDQELIWISTILAMSYKMLEKAAKERIR